MKRVNAIETARVLEMQEKLLKSSVSASVSKNVRSTMNTPKALKEYMIKKGITETFAATNVGIMSRNVKFIINDGKLYRCDIKDNSDTLIENGQNPDKIKAFNFVWTIIAIKHNKPVGYKLVGNKLLKMEYDAIMESGKRPTREDSRQARANMSAARANLPPIDSPLPDYEEMKPLTPVRPNSAVPDHLLHSEKRRALPSITNPSSITTPAVRPRSDTFL